MISINNITDRYNNYLLQSSAYSRDPKKSQQYANDINANNDRYLKNQAAQIRSTMPVTRTNNQRGQSGQGTGQVSSQAKKAGMTDKWDPSLNTQMAMNRIKTPDLNRMGGGMRQIPENSPEFINWQNNVKPLEAERQRIMDDIMNNQNSQYNITDVQKLTNQINQIKGQGGGSESNPTGAEATNSRPDPLGASAMLANILGNVPANGSGPNTPGRSAATWEDIASMFGANTNIPDWRSRNSGNKGEGNARNGGNGASNNKANNNNNASAAQSAQATSAQNRNQPVSLDDLLGMINSAPGYNPINILEERFQNPEQLSSAVEAIMSILEPQTAAQESASRTAYNQQMQNLADNMASSGLLRSGGYASKREQGARDLASNLASIRANQQANAIPMAMQYGQLGMQEQAQRFGQEQANWQNQNTAEQQRLSGLSDIWGKQFGLEQFDWQKYVDQESLKNQRAATAASASAARAGASAQNAIARAQLEQANNQFALEQALQEAQLTGFYNGNPTMAYQNQAWGQLKDMADYLGYFNLPGTGGTSGAVSTQPAANTSALMRQLLNMG